LTAANALRVAVLTNTVPGYRRPILEGVARESGVRLEVFVSLPLDAADPGARDTLVLRQSKGFNLNRRTHHRAAGTEQAEPLHVPVMLAFDLMRFRPDIVISGELGLRSLAGWLVARVRRVPLLLWSEEIAENARAAGTLQRMLRRFLISRANGFLAWGRPAVNYLKSWNVPECRVHYCAQAVDNEFWRAKAQGCDRTTFRREHELEGKVFLAVGRLLPRKGFDKLLLAWATMEPACAHANSLVLAGGGPEEQSLRALVRSRGIPNVTFAGPQEPGRLARWYAAADVFVFPSLVDVWGLVVNEAMACGLPVLASKYAGASQELVGGDGVGALFDPADIPAFAALLRQWCTDAPRVDTARIAETVGRLNFDVSIAAFREALTRHANWIAT
jgi:glycosyltransferase involved in cell wall biosynthesis